MLNITPLIDRLFLPLFEPDSNSRGRGQFFKTANHGSICDSSRGGWAYDYFWLCVGAYSSDWSSARLAGTSAPLILTHDPSSRCKSTNGQQAARVNRYTTTRFFVVVASLNRLLFHPFGIELLASLPNS